MHFMRFGRQGLALLPAVMFAVILSDCATQSSPGVPAPNNRSDVVRKKTFMYTGTKQLFIIPAGVKKITITADGASGGQTSGGNGGLGGMVTATVSVAPGERYAVLVGGSGDHGGFNGGGAGNGSGSDGSGLGGGASDVRNDHSGRHLVDAGGGGGGGAPEGYESYGSHSPAPTTNQYPSGGNGGGTKGGNGLTGGTGSYETSGGGGGRGGTQTAGGHGGAGGTGGCTGQAGSPGTLYKGGGGGYGCYDSGQGGGGGGGGGYYGGGGGGGSVESCGNTYYGEYGYCAWGAGGGGGGGSSFIISTATNVKNVRGGAPAGDGLVVISW